ncbi:MAG: ABC transporter substrate-binding protein [Gammaproteobacteria bacterium]
MIFRLIVTTVLLASVQLVQAADWQAVEADAKGQTVYFYAWGGSSTINQYIERWAQIAEERHDVKVEHVKVDDISVAIQGIQTAKRVGRSDQGSVDVMWINGENFARMKRDGLMGTPFVADLPSSKAINLDDPTIAADFSVPTDGLEAPWGRAQLVFIYDQSRLSQPPKSMDALLNYAKNNPGRVTYPEPPNFHGTTFLKQVLWETTEQQDWLQKPYVEARFEQVTSPMWAYLDSLHLHLWRKGREFPDSAEVMMDLFADGILDIALSFNPNDASQRILDGRFAPSVRTYIHEMGTVGNTHFLAIPFNADARAGALVWINLLLTPEAQAEKADPSVWGDPTVIDESRLGSEDQKLFRSLNLGPATLSAADRGVPLSEPHATWVEPIERAWKERYFGKAR